jgi:hypothetical protein
LDLQFSIGKESVGANGRSPVQESGVKKEEKNYLLSPAITLFQYTPVLDWGLSGHKKNPALWQGRINYRFINRLLTV